MHRQLQRAKTALALAFALAFERKSEWYTYAQLKGFVKLIHIIAYNTANSTS